MKTLRVLSRGGSKTPNEAFGLCSLHEPINSISFFRRNLPGGGTPSSPAEKTLCALRALFSSRPRKALATTERKGSIYLVPAYTEQVSLAQNPLKSFPVTQVYPTACGMAESGGPLGISNPSVVGLESRMMGDYHVRFGEHCSRSFGNSLNSSLSEQRVNDSFAARLG